MPWDTGRKSSTPLSSFLPVHETMTTTMRAAVLFLLPVLGSCGNGSYYGSPYRKPDSDLPYAVSVCYTYTTTYLATCTVTAASSSVTHSHEATRTADTGEQVATPTCQTGMRLTKENSVYKPGHRCWRLCPDHSSSTNDWCCDCGPACDRAERLSTKRSCTNARCRRLRRRYLSSETPKYAVLLFWLGLRIPKWNNRLVCCCCQV